ncbi:hypothetical protein SYNTR_0574 [Candidatus Syntrophocurvum alkaliphilum]|uniref:Flagellar FliJ protein n=1 Tax=Candidatus Syntrophocurvum alkaliphilum TaxID=2293317 RepID=A0A6I6D9P4_9FIRM|nr:flagellar export protein FliJ [Candidatus Syntrophocurvum alkaliphilum]QGT99167.1 hypothetical protein SYNTR_0574 [Candidatus Syntrophocurvum alkaliphilum]
MLKKFNFRLEKNLNISYQEEQRAKENLHEKIKERDVAQEELNIVQNKLVSLEDSIRNEKILQKIMIKKDYIQVLKKLIYEKEEDLNLAQTKLEKARKILIQKSLETKTLEKLKEKEWKTYLLEANREEQKAIDEIASSKHIRENVN